jgi:histidinol-phosphate aminotransferase
MTSRRRLVRSPPRHRVIGVGGRPAAEEGAITLRRLWRPVLDGITPYDAGKPLEALMEELGLSELVRLSANENPLGPSPRGVESICREAERVHLYPDGGCSALRDALGRQLGVSPAQVVVGNGANSRLL